MLPKYTQILFAILSFVIVSFGQPAWLWWSGLITATIGYALFFLVLLCQSDRLKRFYVATVWFTAVQWVQLYWFTSHPYFYAYFLHAALSIMLGLQFGVLGIFITEKNFQHWTRVFALAAFWTISEWLRLFFMSGFSWNPAGLALTGSLYPLQMASLWGVFGLSFWVMVVNLLAVRAWLQRYAFTPVCIFFLAASVPYLYGAIHLNFHQEKFAKQQSSSFRALLVQTAFGHDEMSGIKDKNQFVIKLIRQWNKILNTVKLQYGKEIDLIVFPEYIVAGGAYSFIYPYETVKNVFIEAFGSDSVNKLPPKEEPYVSLLQTSHGEMFLVNNAFWVQALANIFHSGVVVGLEDAEDVDGNREIYAAALYFKPVSQNGVLSAPERYEKRVLVPFGEYIPFEWCQVLAEIYGIKGSFTPGKEAKVYCANETPFGLTICYEETFGDLMRGNKQSGAQILVNLTSDVWYPQSLLPLQHFTHARLRTVENGIPLIRSCNMGITGAIDSLGNTVAVVQEEGIPSEFKFEALKVDVPIYHYQTLYSRFGDGLIIGLSAFILACLGIGFIFRKF